MGRLISATGHSLAGVRQAFHSEAAFRQEVALLVLLLPVALWLDLQWVERALLIGSLLLLLVVELLNSAVEATVDRISQEHHPLSKVAKDYGAAAVFVCLTTVCAVWLLIAVPALARLV